MSATIFAARPTVYRGIRMRSRLEARFAADMDKAGWKWEYEPRCYASEAGQWLPDFETHTPEHIFIELKPTAEAAKAAVGRVHIVYASEPTALANVIWPMGTGWGVIYVARSGKWTTLSTGSHRLLDVTAE